MLWKKIALRRGILVQGDPTTPTTRWWNHLYLMLFRWKRVATFVVDKGIAKNGYYVGFTTSAGESYYKDKLCHDEVFSMKVGHEDCEFFIMTKADLALPGTPTLPALFAVGPLH